MVHVHIPQYVLYSIGNATVLSNGCITKQSLKDPLLSSGTILNFAVVDRFVGSNKLSDLLLQPYDLLKPGWADSYLMGLVNQVQVIQDMSLTCRHE